MAPKRRILILPLLAFIGLTLAFLFPYRQMIEERVAAPLAKLLQHFQELWIGLDGDMVWAFFILMVYVAILLTFPTTRNAPQGGPPENGDQPENRLEFWHYQVQRLAKARGFSRLSVVELRKLVLDVIAFREQLNTRQEAEYWLTTHEGQIPSEVLALFDKKMPSRMEQAGGSGLQASRRLWPWKKARPVSQRQSEEKLMAILQFLEDQFESTHDYYYR